MRKRPYHCRSKTGRVRLLDLDGEPHTVLNEEGKVYGELFVVRFLRAQPCGKAAKKAVFLCICSCGQHCEVAGSCLRAAHNNTVSCGHVQAALRSQRGEAALGFKHGRCVEGYDKKLYNARRWDAQHPLSKRNKRQAANADMLGVQVDAVRAS